MAHQTTLADPVQELQQRVARLEYQVQTLMTQVNGTADSKAVREAVAPYIIEAAPQPATIIPSRDNDEDTIVRNRELIALLDRWAEEGDAEEQRETWGYLRQALDEDRPSYRKLFL